MIAKPGQIVSFRAFDHDYVVGVVEHNPVKKTMLGFYKDRDGNVMFGYFLNIENLKLHYHQYF